MISRAVAQEVPRNATPPAQKANAKKAAEKTAEELRQIDEKIKKHEEQAAPAPDVGQAQFAWWTTTSAMTMSAAVLTFGFLTLCLACYVLRKGHQWEAVLKIFGMVLIIVMTIFLVVAGYDDKQISGAVALLGTVAGYLLGKEIAKHDTPAPVAQQGGPSKPPARQQGAATD